MPRRSGCAQLGAVLAKTAQPNVAAFDATKDQHIALPNNLHSYVHIHILKISSLMQHSTRIPSSAKSANYSKNSFRAPKAECDGSAWRVALPLREVPALTFFSLSALATTHRRVCRACAKRPKLDCVVVGGTSCSADMEESAKQKPEACKTRLAWQSTMQACLPSRAVEASDEINTSSLRAKLMPHLSSNSCVGLQVPRPNLPPTTLPGSTIGRADCLSAVGT